jgi:RNA polymerase sigma-70 factor (ECF subfamily)
MYKKLTDSELLKLMQTDDHGAFNELYLRYWEKLVAIALQRVKDLHIAQDIMQEVFVNLWKNRRRAEILKPENYLATAVKYLSLTHLRSGKKMRIVEEEDAAAYLSDDITADQLLYSKHLLALIHKETNTLPPVRQLVFRYSRLEGYSIKEIAEEMDLSPSTVKSHLTKALAHFRKILKISILWFRI